ncbi:hypothetical protein CASFOL_030962 [Castilleja foliolosa]|uniref:Bromo domain-containing protein n=1 Tax=Castilleja foliolosa TaxID=1961234 RepID=A0ABD3C6V3_9LAMI
MAKLDGVAPEAKDDDVSPSWGTWEELILAFAVNRHGTASWDSIASELQKRASDPNLSLTAHNCRSKYLDLKRRFVAASNDDADGGKSESAAPLLEELRKLRVAELRREVQRYDLNIESLELKVKSLEDEREKSVSDLENNGEEEKINVEPEAEPAIRGEPVVGDEMEKDQISVNESNSTDPCSDKLITSEKESEPAGTGAEDLNLDRAGKTIKEPADLKPEPDRKSLRADSCNGSSNSIDKSDRKGKDEPVTDSADLVESEAESDGGGEETKENSDVQSTASRSRKEEGSDKVRRGNTSGDEREHEDQSRAVKELSAKSQPLFDFLQAIRAHKLGSTFERRLRSQETSKYQKLILQHIDFEKVETKLREGWYAGSRIKFFRDLLLLVNNALVFFSKKSTEANAANELRKLISKEISNKKAKSGSSSGKQASLQSLSMSKKDEPDPSNSLIQKGPQVSGSLIVCRKRSSIANKASGSSSGKKKEQISPLTGVKDSKTPSVETETDEPKVTKKRTRENQFSSSTPANTKKKGKNNSITKQHEKGGGSSSEQPKSDNKKGQTGLDSKKRGAASFLNRIKQGSSSSNNGVLLDALKNTPLTNEGSAGKGGSDQKKNENTKQAEKKEQVTRRSTVETRQTKDKEEEKGSPGKKNVGRPPKRGAAPLSVIGKRGKERGEMETPPGKQQPKKRTRKL